MVENISGTQGYTLTPDASERTPDAVSTLTKQSVVVVYLYISLPSKRAYPDAPTTSITIVLLELGQPNMECIDRLDKFPIRLPSRVF